MATFDVNAVNRAFAVLFANGTGEAGLEVGNDPGLATNEYIQIPISMRKNWCARIRTEEGATAPAEYGGTPMSMLNVDGWVTTGKIFVNDGTLYAENDDGTRGRELDVFYVEPVTATDVRNFVAANLGHIRDDAIPADAIPWVLACRFWAVAAGFVTTTKSAEWVEVPNPTAYPAQTDEYAAYIAEFHANAWTASAARAASWRKSNHATGGDVVQGFPRRWLNKMGFIRDIPDRNAARVALRAVTAAFYVATHASSVHAVLALMVPDDSDHWACIDPKYGLIEDWDIGRSARIRMEPKTQVAGAAVVVDAVVVLKMTIKEGIAPLITAIDQVGPLMAAHARVEELGVRCASYAKWFLQGHPDSDAHAPVAFDQKDSAFAELAGELAVIGTRYYHGSTISGSAALANAAGQMCPEDVKATWAAVAANRQKLSGQQVIAAVQLLKGSSAVGAVSQILDGTVDNVRAGIAAYNTSLTTLAGLAGVPSVLTISADRVLAARFPGGVPAAPDGTAAAEAPANA